MPRSLLRASLLLAALAFSPLSVHAQDAAGHLLIVGGGRQPPELVQHFVELAGGARRARIAIFPMASGDAEATGQEKAEQLRGMGAEAIVMNLSRDQAQSDSAARLLDGVTGVWFPGGDQSRLAPVLQGTPVLAAIHDRYRAGAVIAGTSAGAAIMADSMITGDQRRPPADTVGYFGDEYPRVALRTIVIAPGFGFLPSAIVDQHFLKRERHNRLLAATLEHPGMIGVGIDESTALQVNPDGGWEVVGASAVVIYDARSAAVTPAAAPVLGASGIRMHLLSAGSLFDPATGRATLPASHP